MFCNGVAEESWSASVTSFVVALIFQCTSYVDQHATTVELTPYPVHRETDFVSSQSDSCHILSNLIIQEISIYVIYDTIYNVI